MVHDVLLMPVVRGEQIKVDQTVGGNEVVSKRGDSHDSFSVFVPQLCLFVCLSLSYGGGALLMPSARR